jgi:RNA polymerase sigma factor for flagellar operon FliA
VSEDDLYSSHADTIEAVIKAVCRRHRLTEDDRDELGQRIRLKLVDNDYAVLRRFAGRSTMRTYLVSVAEHVFQDWRNSEWGKWRPCQEARRIGPLAVELDRLLTRDLLPYDQAVETLISRGQGTRAEMDAIRLRLATRQIRRPVDGEILEDLPATSGAPEESLEHKEYAAQAAKVAAAFTSVFRALPPSDQVIVRLRLQPDLTLDRIARMQGQEPKRFYRYCDKLDDRIHEAINQLGVSTELVKDLLAGGWLELPPFGSECEGK